MSESKTDTKFARLKWRRSVDRWRAKAALLANAVKAGFDPNQPRVPAGNPDGGQWTSGGGGSGSGRQTPARDKPGPGTDLFRNPDEPRVHLAQARGPRGGSTIRFGNQTFALTARQTGEYAGLKLRADAALIRVRQIDPTWKPRPNAATPRTAQGVIETLRGNATEAEARLRELANLSPTQRIDTYRTLNNSRDLFGNETWPRDRGAVMTLTIDRLPVIGANSGSPAYSSRDRRDADQLRMETVPRLPSGLQRNNIGQIPYDAFYHAETTVLLRARRANGGTLAGRRLVVFGDRPMCSSCELVLPHIGLRLGNPTVTFVSPSGARRTMQDGLWLD